jgi:hypothetical protein
MADCVATIRFCKTAAAKKEKGANLVVQFARRWAPNMAFAAGEPCRPSEADGQTGLQYDPGAGGCSNGATEPKWPKVTTGPKSSVKDGPITWQAEAQTVASLHERIASVDWDVQAGITFDEVAPVNTAFEQSIGGQWSGGDPGKDYVAVALVTTTRGNQVEVRFIITIDPPAAA